MLETITNTFTKKPFKERLKDTGFLLKHSFTVIGKDKDILKPAYRMLFYSILTTTLFFVAIFLFFTKYFPIGILILFVLLFFFWPFGYFFYIRQKADQSWIVYNTITGKDISHKDAHMHTKKEKSRLRFVAFIDFLMGRVKTANNHQQKGFLAFIVRLALSFLIEIWDLLSHYMLPAIVIEQKPLKEIIPKIKALKSNVPATLVGVFGIDFVGNVVKGIAFTFYLIFFILSIGLGYLLSFVMTSTIFTFPLLNIQISWVPVIIMLYIVILISHIIRVFVESTKVIYFTIFYTSIMRPKEIEASMREELTHYLKMEETSKKS
ncbi:MAG: hypothetical protein KKA65_00935 [Nanoarchaeota archaeon]|nr:hypothetical protein [Nanoarchaeota archaeon]MBU4352727.1 hypothetical protein [Nanoarchaeota archaeon]MBU4456043.1 hypothetical protein [Nanoarchaeota archaeon]MCG2720114.1 hypothetical protein [Nanoarchaeota archaeon]